MSNDESTNEEQCAGLSVTGKPCPNKPVEGEVLCPVCKQKPPGWMPQQKNALIETHPELVPQEETDKQICQVQHCEAEPVDDTDFCEIHDPDKPENYPLVAVARCMGYLPTGHRCPEKPVSGGCCAKHQDVAKAIADGEPVAAPVAIPPSYSFDENVKRLYESLAVCHNISVFGENNKDRINAARAEGYLINILAAQTKTQENEEEDVFLDIVPVDQQESGKIISYDELQELKEKKKKDAG